MSFSLLADYFHVICQAIYFCPLSASRLPILAAQAG
jgi:hypothetical protein